MFFKQTKWFLDMRAKINHSIDLHHSLPPVTNLLRLDWIKGAAKTQGPAKVPWRALPPLHMFSLPFYGSLLTDEQQVNNSRSKENNLPHEHHTSAKERFSSTTVPWKRKNSRATEKRSQTRKNRMASY
jgi:hypothetical protein